MSAIKVRSLSKVFKEKTAVNQLSFDIPYGEVTALLGSNGAGKSTKLNMIAGFLSPTSGEIDFEGRTYDKNDREIKLDLGYLTCDMALYDQFTIRENLEFLGELKGFDKKRNNQRIDELVEHFSLHEIISMKYGELSSGQKQRSLISASVIHDPKILIFDEVTASLDLLISKGIMDFLKSEKEKGKAIIFSTHILSEVEYLSDRILLIEKGSLLKKTTYSELIKDYKAQNLTEAFYKVLQEVSQNK